ncbi:MAG: hypothetical protein ACOZCO_09540 [Bacteroidota bacterium]
MRITSSGITDGKKWQGQSKLNEKYLFRSFSIEENGNTRACAALYFNPGISHNGKKTFLLGNYECENDFYISEKLFQHIFQTCTENDIDYLIGPMNGSTWNAYRFCVEKTGNPFFLEPDQPDWYPEQFHLSGFDILADYISSRQTLLHPMDERTKNRKAELENENIEFRKFRKNNFYEEINKLYPLCIKTFSENFLYTPLSETEFLALYEPLLSVMNENIIFIAEDNGQPAGFIFGLDDLLNKNQKGLIVKTLARDNNEKYKGIANVLSGLITQYAFENNYSYLIHALMIENNASVKVSSNYHGNISSRYRLYIKSFKNDQI